MTLPDPARPNPAQAARHGGRATLAALLRDSRADTLARREPVRRFFGWDEPALPNQ